MKYPIGFIAIVGIALFGAGCGKTASVPSSSKSVSVEPGAVVDPCTFVTKQEVEQLLGQSVDDPKSTNQQRPLGQRICSYVATEKGHVVGIQISLVQEQGFSSVLLGNGYSASKFYDDERVQSQKTLSFSGAVKNTGEKAFGGDVDGVGDKAYWDSTLGLTFLKGKTVMTVKVDFSGNSQQKAIDLAKQILTKLP